MKLQKGSIFSHYEILEELGQGGSGMVYKAIDPKLERIVALKLIGESSTEQPDSTSQLLREAKKAALIDSPNVVHIWEYSEFQGIPYISLEYIEGESLADACLHSSLSEKISLARQIAEGVYAAHQKGIIHRDLKPQNIMLNTAGQAKILDFGIAKTLRADTVDSTGNVEGTLYYMSPEQVSGENLDFRSDVFSYGTLLYELFTGARPFTGDYTAAVIYAILYEDPLPPCNLDPELPAGVDSLIMKCIAKDPSARFASFGDIVQQFEMGVGRGDDEDPGPRYFVPSKTVTLIDIKNLSGDESWGYFCTGFSEDLTREISRRTNLVVSSEPDTRELRNIQKLFRQYRSDFIITGSLRKWQKDVRLNLSIYKKDGGSLLFGEQYKSKAEKIFELLSQAANEASEALATLTGGVMCEVEDYLATNFSAYDYYLKGKSYYQTSKPDELELAEKMYKMALQVDPDLALAMTGLSDVYAYQYMAYYDRTPEKIEMARSFAEKALEINPKLPEAERSLGRYFMNLGDFDNAESVLTRSIEIDPKFAIGYRTLAWLKLTLGEYEPAREWAQKTLRYAPTDLETLLLLSLIYLDQRKFTLALATLQRAVELGPDYGRAYYNLGVVYMKLGVLDLALENFDLAIKYQGDPNSYIEAGYIHLINRNYEPANKRFQESIDAEHLPFIALYYLGFLKRLQGNEERAIALFIQAIISAEKYEKADPQNIYVLSFKALAHAAQNNKSEALAIIKWLADRSQDQGDVLYNIARCYAYFGDMPNALEYIDKALNKIASPTNREISVDPHFKAIKQHVSFPSK
jgi:serine/threonine protein kinase/Flp pilus assembly protein TadD